MGHVMSKAVIVVGVDGRPQGDDALRFAIDEAQRTGDTIEVVTAWSMEPPAVLPYGWLSTVPTVEQLQGVAQELQDTTVHRVFEGRPSMEIACRVVEGDAGSILVEAARHARLLVVGTRGLGPVAAAVLGSVSRYCAAHAGCPVVVVPSPRAVARQAELVPRAAG
jgi:nucleotide-binding universal stress UspA family protein